jgi:transcriptional regulator with GAF, ATPase, and Fis domain
MSGREGWRRARLETILDLSLAFSRPRRESEVVEELVQRAVGLLDARAGLAVSLLPTLEPVATCGVGWPAGAEHTARLATAPELRAVREGGVARVEGRKLDLPFGEILVAACSWHEALMAIVAVADREAREGRERFDDEDVSFLRSIALLAGPAIASRRALEAVERERQVLEDENRALRAEVGEAAGLVGQSPAFRQVIEIVRRVASTDVTVLVRGESGTGKERITRLLHSLSPRRHGPFVPLNCAAVPESLLEAELFGIEGGVATGVSARVGKLELAHGGTLFLDEVGDLSAALQAKLLRVLQDREVERVGGRQLVHVDIRLVTATNRDLESMMERGEFRPDLYYRLRVIELRLPPLRERREDIAPLAHHFLSLLARRLGRPRITLSHAAREDLLAHNYPGNVRELENVLEAAAALAPSDRIDDEDLRLAFGVGGPSVSPGGSLDEIIRRHVLATLERCEGSRAAAARDLGIDRSTLYRMLSRWNATDVAFRNTSEREPRQRASRERSR